MGDNPASGVKRSPPMKLPSADRVQIDDRKIREYLLSRTHAVGRFKARFFAAVGFDETTATAFVAEIRRIAESARSMRRRKSSSVGSTLFPAS